jgi:hypothetical protein
MIFKSAEVNSTGEDKPVLDKPQQKEPLKETAIELLDIRRAGKLPAGRCLYLQSGDPGDVDGKEIPTYKDFDASGQNMH